MFKLRPYQQRLIDVAMQHLHDYPESVPMIVAPTGSGKSVIVAELCIELSKIASGMVLVLTHRRELVAQNAAKLPAHLNAGIYSAGLGKKELRRVTIAGFQSIRKKVDKLPKVSYILVDECQWSISGYREFIDSVREKNPALRVIGLTATPFDGTANRTALHLMPADKRIFSGIGAEVTMGELLRDGYLTPLKPYQPNAKLDTTGVEVDARTGDFAMGQLQAAVDIEGLNVAVAHEITSIFAYRNAVMVFCAGVDHATHVRDCLRAIGEQAEVVLGDTPSVERERILTRFKAGKLKYLVACEVLLVGFDAPICDGIANLRPSKSALVWLQLLGRGMRLFDGKDDCIGTGQRVLTDQGLVAIESIDTSMKVWDGVEFVAHDGVIYKGEQNVIEYAGLIGTPDHKVWTAEGWETLKTCSEKQIAIAVTGDGWRCVEQSDNHFRRGHSGEGSTIHANQMQHLRKHLHQGAINLIERFSWLRALWQPCHVEARYPEMVIGQSECCEREVQEYKQFPLSLLRWARDKVSLCGSGSYGSVGAGKLGFAQIVGVKQDKQQWSLRSWQLGIHNTEDQHQQQSNGAGDRQHAQIQNCSPQDKLRRQHFGKFDSYGSKRFGNSGEVQHEIMQTKRGVWDILNAGPRHRFTCEGLLVSNCLVADFTDNAVEFGPVDEVEGRPPKLKSGEAPTKQCEECFSIVLAGLKFCPVCGFEFTFEARDNAQQFDAATGLLISGVIKNEDGSRTYPVERVEFEIRTTRNGDPALVAHYHSPGRASPVACEFYNLFHHNAGTVRRDSERWLRRQKNPGGSVPLSAQEALARCEMGALRVPKSVTVRPGSPWPIRFT